MNTAVLHLVSSSFFMGSLGYSG